MKLYILLLLPLALFGVPLSTLIENAKNSHISLKVIEQKLSLLDDEYDISRNFSDPEISFNISDIQFDKPTDRSIEPMQYEAINIKQKLLYFGKRDLLSAKIDSTKEKIKLSMDALKVKLSLGIKTTAYTIWQIEENLRITDAYIKLTKQNIELSSVYASSDNSSHMSIMSAEMSLSELKIKKSTLKSSLVGLYKKLSYLSAMDVDRVEMDMKVTQPQKLSFYSLAKTENLSLKIKKSSLDVADKDVKIKELNSYIDPMIQIGYFHRDKYEDYANVGISFSLPLYGTQDSKTEIARKQSIALKSELVDFNNLIESKIVQTHAELEDAYNIYDIIQNQSMPQIEHMFELSSSSIQNGSELFLYINLLEKKLSLDEKSIAIVAKFHKTKASLDALIGK